MWYVVITYCYMGQCSVMNLPIDAVSELQCRNEAMIVAAQATEPGMSIKKIDCKQGEPA